ncbi:hypothetical protein [Zhongshania sp.]|uniref:hypothetical protein n=1 Tax=Zhongshania sp. TaxID=1971902 RepID=UPI0035683ABA
MINLDDYRLAWQVYMGVGALAIAVWFLLLRRISSAFVRYWLFFAAAAFLFIPGRHPASPELWVPGSATAVLTVLTEGIEDAMSILLVLVAGQILALILAAATMSWVPSGQTQAKSRPGVKKSAKLAPNNERKEPSL